MRRLPLLLLLCACFCAAAALPWQESGEKRRHFSPKAAALSPESASAFARERQHFPPAAQPPAPDSAVQPGIPAAPTADSATAAADSFYFLVDSARIRLVTTPASPADSSAARRADSLRRAGADSLLRLRALQPDSLWSDTMATLLDSFVVKARQPDVVTRGDTLVYNAENFQLPGHATLRDLLRLLPGVEITDNGSVTVNGNSLSSLYIGGRRFRLADLDQAIDLLPSNIVSRLKVYRRPSREEELTGISTSGGEMVLDLAVKEDMKTSLQVTAELRGGRDLERAGKMRDGTSLQGFALDGENNYSFSLWTDRRPYEHLRNANKSWNTNLGFDRSFSRKLSLTPHFSSSDNENFSRFLTTTRTFLPDSTGLVEKNSYAGNYSSRNYGLNLQAEWRPNERNILTAQFSADFRRSLSEQTSLFSSQDQEGDTLNHGTSASANRTRSHSLRTRLTHSLRFGKEGRVLYTSLDLSLSSDRSEETREWLRHEYEDGLYRRDSTLHERSRGSGTDKSASLQVSWVEPIGKKHKIQVLTTLDFSQNRNVRSAYEAAGEEVRLSLPLSNEDRQERNSQQARLFLQSKWEKYEQNLGLSFERIDSRTRNFSPTAAQARGTLPATLPTGELPEMRGDSLLSEVELDNVNFSPIFNFTWHPREDIRLAGSYNGRLTSPTPYQLRDYTDVSNPQNTVQGNPGLKPTFTHSFSLNYSSSGAQKRGYRSAAVSGNVITNQVKTVSDIDLSTGHRHTTYRNVNGNYSLSAHANAYQPLGKQQVWGISGSANASYRQYRTYSNGQPATLRPYSLGGNLGIRYNKDQWNLNLSGSFRYERAQAGAGTAAVRHQKDWGLTARGYAQLPWKLYLDTDFSWTLRRGYGDGADYGRAVWNLRLTRELFQVRLGTASLTLEGYDFLPGRLPVTRVTGDNMQHDFGNSYRESYVLTTFRFQFQHQFGQKGGKEE